MKTNKKLAASIASFAAASACLVGGTYAWFIIATTAETTMSGQMVNVEGIKVGIRSAEDLTVLTGYADMDLVQELDDQSAPTGVYWSEHTEDGDEFADGVLEFVAEANKFGKTFTPVTTKSFVDDQAITLHKGLDGTAAKAFTYDDAATSDYFQYTLVLKIDETVSGEKDIHLKGTSTSITGDSANVADALRVGFEADGKSRIFKQGITAAQEAAGTNVTKVGGRMDLDGDSVWDYFEINDKKFEIFYGEFDKFDDTDDEIDILGEVALDKTLYGVTYLETAVAGGREASVGNTNFMGASVDSLKGVYTFDEADGVKVKAATQVAHGLSSFVPGATPIVTTEDGLAEVTITIWAEGWDPACENSIKADEFTVNLGFIAI